VVKDNCVAGTLCDNNGPGSAWTCRTVCAADGDCTTSGQKCISSSGYNVCMPTCTLAFSGSSDCGPGSDCSVPWPDVASTDSSPVGYYVCKATGSGQYRHSCLWQKDCGAGLYCAPDGKGGALCLPNCDSSNLCPGQADGGAPLTCHTFSNQSNGSGHSL
jgi:hypothetical protein